MSPASQAWGKLRANLFSCELTASMGQKEIGLHVKNTHTEVLRILETEAIVLTKVREVSQQIV